MPVADDLAVQLRRADSRRLREMVVEHLSRFSIREVRQTLMNPFATAEVLEELLAARDLVSIYEVRAALARHRSTPAVAAMRLIPGLYWRDLLEVSVDLRIRPEVRRVAEKYLRMRLPRLTTGEKVALAHRAPEELHAMLLRDPELRVVGALLGNARLRETTVLQLIQDPKTPTRPLARVAGHASWGSRYAVRAALARNPAAPFRAIFAALPHLRRADLEEIAAQESHSSVVRARARDLLEIRRSPRALRSNAPPPIFEV